jgi:thiol-disulfide isomerase/thioredoxin
MKKFILGVFALVVFCFSTQAQESVIKIKGTVKFPDSKFKMEVFFFDGPEKKIIDTFDLNADNSFERDIKIPRPGKYTLNCQKWESIAFWGENETVEVNFRGLDTAKMKIKNPPYHAMVNPGKNNELMNLYNFFGYRSYQRMIASGQEQYKASKSGCENWMEYAKEGYTRGGKEDDAYTDFLAINYADRNAILAVLPGVYSESIRKEVIAIFEKNNPTYAPFVEYKKNIAYAKAQKERLANGKMAPEFSLPTPNGKKNISIKDYRGKYLLVDFWASWCGPCRQAIPHVKEVYDKYNKRGFEVLSVSVDKDDKAWRKAMDEEKMSWDQVCAPNSGKQVMQDYQFNGIPHLVLIDKEGNIIAKGITPDNLNKELEKIFK